MYSVAGNGDDVEDGAGDSGDDRGEAVKYESEISNLSTTNICSGRNKLAVPSPRQLPLPLLHATRPTRASGSALKSSVT